MQDDDPRRPNGEVQPPGLDDTPPEGFAAVQPPIRVCRHCSVQSQVAGEFCPHCGKAFARRQRFGRLRKTSRRAKIVVAAVIALLVAGGVVGLVLKERHDDQIAAEKKEKEEAAAQAEAERVAAEQEREREEAESQAALDDLELEGRKDLERGLRKEIKKDAEEKVNLGLLEGPILSAHCDPVGGGRDDLEAKTGKYECMAVNEENADGTARGYEYDGTINYDEFSYTWQLAD